METIELGCDGVAKWHWFNVMNDLHKQGGLENVLINPLTVNPHGCGGEHEGNSFYITWLPNKFLLVTMQQFSQQLMDAFARVVEYRPFCRYDRDGMVTIEWDKNNPTARFAELQKEEEISNLVAL